MLTKNRARLQERRGIALILILGMLGLLAFIGVTFATIAGQARIGARNYAQSVMQPQPTDLMEFALSQLIGDTDDYRSAIRGHSLARDMYGNDAQNNGYVDVGAGIQFSTATPTPAGTVDAAGASLVGTIQCVTNIPAPVDATQPYYGYSFTRWVIKFNAQAISDGSGNENRLVSQTFEVVYDDALSVTSGYGPTLRIFYVAPLPNPMPARAFQSPETAIPGDAVVNQSILLGDFVVFNGGNAPTYTPFSLDGRFLRAFNGPGMGPVAQYANMKYNRGMLIGDDSVVGPSTPNSLVGMDEDYDACDLENWFLAIQSADGHAIVPSFHRPGVVQATDWSSNSAQSKSRILRPRNQDGHDAVSFPDLTPQASGKITYDVDNDADGVTDSVWVDLGYPPIRDSRGLLYKPMFAFMVLGLNGRIPLNTAGNLNQRDRDGQPLYMNASHLGYSPSEVDPTFGLQNWPLTLISGVQVLHPNTQLDNAYGYDMNGSNAWLPISVNVTQLRNILAGTRPNPSGLSADSNAVQTVVSGARYLLPNGVPDLSDNLSSGVGYLPSRSVAGRWGEASFITSYFNTGGLTPVMKFANLVRAGMSVTGTSQTVQTADGRDDNNTALDSWPSPGAGEFGGASTLAGAGPWPADYRDAAGDRAVFAERARRFVTPMDITGDGKQFNYHTTNTTGADEWGRVRYNNYFRPPGIPPATVGGVPVLPAITGQTTSTAGAPSMYDVTNNLYHGFESHRNPSLHSDTSDLTKAISNTWKDALKNAATPTTVDADGNDGALNPGGLLVPTSGGLPYDKTAGTTPTPTFTANISSLLPGSPGLNEPNETALYEPDATDQIFGAKDLEWLYRAHDQDGTSLYSRLSELAPLSFRDSADAMRRRRMYSIDVWDTNSITWSNDNPGSFNPATGFYSTGGNFSDNSRFLSPFINNTTTGLPMIVSGVSAANASLASLKLRGFPYVQGAAGGTLQSSTPALAHRDRKINLNFPLPVSNSSTEATRIKWITESYQFLKTVLPPLSIDTPEELAALSQFLVNIIDFRDPDATMTRFVNPDVFIRLSTTTGTAPDLVLRSNTNAADPLHWLATDVALVQHGMEYNPIAINEVLAYAYQAKATGATPIPRFFIELVNTLTDAQTAYPPVADTPNASWLNLGGVKFVAGDPYGTTSSTGGCWDLIFTDDDPMSRPDPFTGQLPSQAAAGYYGPVPLHRESFTSATQDVVIRPLNADGLPPAAAAPNYFYCIGNTGPGTGSEANTPVAPMVAQTWTSSFDPFQETSAQAPPTFTIPAGVLPNDANGNPVTTYPARMTPPTTIQTGSLYKWVCLRRPANPFKEVSAANPMIVVDSMRFPFIEASGTLVGSTNQDDKGGTVPSLTAANQVYSVERFQPYRGGHLVPQVNTVLGATRYQDVTRYGYTEQQQPGATKATDSKTTTQGIYSQSTDGKTNYYATKAVFSTLGAKGKVEDWERFVFNDRDFTSPAELTLVPGCPPGLFTKQFVEFAPSTANLPQFYSAGNPAIGARNGAPPLYQVPPSTTVPGSLGVALSTAPPTFPYLVDQLFYSSASPSYNGATTWDKVVGPSSGGWYKMFEVFEVPSPVIGATGTVAQGVNYDWLRQDVRPGQLNLNLIIDEEVFLGLMGNAGVRAVAPPNYDAATPLQQVIAVPTSLNGLSILSATPKIVTEVNNLGVPTNGYNLTNTGFYDAVVSGNVYLKQAFSDFLSIRHGSNSYIDTVNPINSTNFMFFGAAPPILSTQPFETPFRSLTNPDIDFTIMKPAFPTKNRTLADHGTTQQDAGVKNVALVTRTLPFAQATPYFPPAIPPRRLFQLPDTDANSGAALTMPDPYQLGYVPPQIATLQNPNVSMANTADPTKILNASQQHPYYRSEWLQKVMNLSTVRTHQYAVWVTVGFFEVTTVGDAATSSFDVIGREVGTLQGKNFRHRAFFIVDRLKLGGYDARNPGQYKDAVLYRKIIQ